ncbi:MAG: fibronectin type III domain-containing protein [Thermoguttaceae bacterium]|nr:fibronectin type III domain-containing protein [Thermoguttaceae bacterium]
MKRSKLTSYFSNLRKESAKNARPSQLRLESLEARQLLSVTDVATLAAASEAEQPAAYTTAAPVSDAVIDVSSVLVTTAAPQQSELNVLKANGFTDETINSLLDAEKIKVGYDGYISQINFANMSDFAGKDFDFTGLAKLKNLDLTNCGINSLAIANSASLQTLYVNGNSLTDLDVSGCSSLYNLQCADNAIEDLNLAGTALTILNCSGNNISELDLSSSSRLTSLACFDNNLTVIDATPCANLGSLQFYDGLLETVYVNHNADVTMQIYVKKSECDLSVVDAENNEITATASENYFQFTLGAAAANPITATVTFRNANGATQTIEIDPYIKLDATEGSVYAVVSENVELTGMSIFGMADPTFKVSVAGYTVEESAEFVKVEDNTLIYVGGLASSATPYNVTVTVEDGDAVDSADFALTVAQYKLAAPANLAVSETAETSIGLVWDAGDEYAQSYTVDVYSAGELVASQTTAETSATVSGLDANTEYTFNVTATGDDLEDSDAATVTARTDMATLATPTGFAVSAATESTISLTWTDVVNATGYTVDIIDGDVAVATQTVTDVAATFEGLDANTEYTFRVQATTLGMNPSDYAYVTGHTDMATLDAPTNLTAAATDTTVTLAWDAVEGAAVYVIEGYGETTDTTFTVADLDPNTEYAFSVVATADAMYPSSAATVTVTTEKATLAAPTDLAADADVNSVTLTWTAVEGATAYVIDGYGETSDTTFTAYDLAPETEYTFNVKATADGMNDSEFATVTVTTEAEPVIVYAIELSASEKTVADSAADVKLADVALTGYTDAAEFAVTVNGDASEAVAVVDGKLVYAGGLEASETAYAITVTVSEGEQSSSAEFALTVMEVAGPAITLSTDSPLVGGRVTTTLDPAGNATYQWYVGESEDSMTLTSIKSSYFTPSANQMGKYLKVVATYTSGDYAGVSVEAISSDVIKRTVTAVTFAKVVPYVGKEVFAYTAPVAATADIQWYRVASDGTEEAIEGANTRYYTPTDADITYSLKVVAIGTGFYVGEASAITQVPVVAENPLTLSTTSPILGHRITTKLNPADSFSSWQWYRDSGTDWVSINGATYSYYTPSYNDVGHRLRVVATYARGANKELSTSAITEAVKWGVTSITINGDADLQIGTELTTKVQGKAATVEYQWYRGANASGDAWTAIPDATEAGYTVTDADAGYYLKVVATGVGDYAGTVEDVTATPVYAERLVVSTDSPALGERVTATVVPADSYATYQWSLVDANGNETALTNATFSYFTPSYNHVGYWLKVTATYQRGDFAGQTFSKVSENPIARKLGQVTITPDYAIVGTPLKAYHVPTYATVDIQWYRVDSEGTETAVEGANSLTYTPTMEDAGYAMKIVVTGTGSYFGESSATSAIVEVPNPGDDLGDDLGDEISEALLDTLALAIL